MHITDIAAAVVQDSRQKPTIAVTVSAGEYTGTFSVPSGASTGEREVLALPAAEAVAQLAHVVGPALVGHDVADQAGIDAALHELDGTANFSTIGGNTALGVSVAALKAAAASNNLPTWQYVASLFGEAPQAAAPRLFVNLINGGAHADRGSQIQEHQVIPETDNVHEAFRVASAIQRALHEVLQADFSEAEIGIGDEGGFMVPTTTLAAPFAYLNAAIIAADSNCEVSLGTDIAASSFATEAGYTLAGETLSSTKLVERLSALRAEFPRLRYAEDPAGESDMAGFSAFLVANPEMTVIGDDVTTTAHDSLQAAIEAKAVSGIIIKPNQIGTISDTFATMRLAYQHNVRCVVSHRSGETMDDFIADLAYGTKAFGLKAGAPTAKERLAKYQRLLNITAHAE
jgi:enolase